MAMRCQGFVENATMRGQCIRTLPEGKATHFGAHVLENGFEWMDAIEVVPECQHEFTFEVVKDFFLEDPAPGTFAAMGRGVVNVCCRTTCRAVVR